MDKKFKTSVIVLLIMSVVFGTYLWNTGHVDNEQTMKVYSFDGENHDLKLNNGVIVVSPDKQVIDGGKIELLTEEIGKVKAYNMKLFRYVNGDEEPFLSNWVSFKGESAGVNLLDEITLNEDVGSISGAGVFAEDQVLNSPDNLFFSLSGITEDGQSFNYVVQLHLAEVYS